MVQELRQIILSKAEFISALEGHRRMAPGFLPNGQIVAFEMLDPTTVMVTIETGENAEIARVPLTQDKLLKPLVRFCLENNIMLPREGRKSVVLTESNISLCISLEVEALSRSSMDYVLPPAQGAVA